MRGSCMSCDVSFAYSLMHMQLSFMVVMAVIVLLSIAVLLAFCCNFNFRKLSANYLKPLLVRYESQRHAKQKQQQHQHLQQEHQEQIMPITVTGPPTTTPTQQQHQKSLQQHKQQHQQSLQPNSYSNNNNHFDHQHEYYSSNNKNKNNNNNNNNNYNNNHHHNSYNNNSFNHDDNIDQTDDDNNNKNNDHHNNEFYRATEIKIETILTPTATPTSTPTLTSTDTTIISTSVSVSPSSSSSSASASASTIASTLKPKRTKGIWDIPGPRPIPLLGTKWIFFLFFRKYKMSSLHEAYADFNRRYGDIVLEVMPSGIPIVHLYNRRDLEKVLKYPSKYPFRPPTEIVVMYRQSRPDRYASVGITNEQGPTWQKLRSSLTSCITSPRILQNFLPALNCVCDDFIELLRQERDPLTNEIDNFEEFANLMGLEAVCTLMLGRRMGFLTKNQPEKIRSLAGAVKQLFISQRDSYYGLGLWKYFRTETYRKFVEAEEIIYDVISELVEKTLEEHNNSPSCAPVDGDEEGTTALRSVFLHILDIKDLDIRDKKSAIIDFIAAGIETLANTLLFVLSSVISDSNATKRILDEFRRHSHTHILQEDFTKAAYTKACIQESYRIRPTAFCLARILEEDMELSGYQLKAGTVVLCQNMIACHKDQNFNEANEFRPERWIDSSGNFTMNIESSTIVVPFGIGKRTCPGKRFVEMEVLLLLAKLTLAFDITFKEPLETEFEFLLAPKTPLTLILRDRID